MEESHRKEFRKEKDKEQSRLPQDVIYVAVGEDVSQDGPTLEWALNMFKGHKICVFHVRQPSVRDASAPASGSSYKMPIAGGERGKRDMPKEDYLKIAKKSGVDMEILYHENDSTLTGILQFINLHNVERLVMGGGPTSLTTSAMLFFSRLYSKRNALSKSDKPQREIPRLRSTKAKYVNQAAPSFCRIWFVSNNDLLFTRELGAGMFGLDRLIKAENIQNPFLFFFLASVRLRVAVSYEFGLMGYRGGYIDGEIKRPLKKLGNLLSALTKAIAAGGFSSYQFYKINKSLLRFKVFYRKGYPYRYELEEFCSKIQLILKDCPSEKQTLLNPNYLQSTSSSSTFLKMDFLNEVLGYSEIKGEAGKVHDEVLNISEIPLYLVPLLAYCSLFPKGHTLVRESLVNMWIAEEFLLPVVDNLNDKEVIITWYTNKDGKLDDIGNQYFEELLLRGVFQEPVFFGGTVYSCQIHPLAHDVASRIAAQKLFMINSKARDPDIYGELHSKHKEASYLVINTDNDLPMSSVDDKLNMFHEDNCVGTCLFFGTTDAWFPIDRHFFNKFIHIQVLDLYRIQVEKLPFSYSMSLRYLGLSGNREIKELSGYFPHLQTLAADGCIQLNHFSTIYITLESIQNLYLTTKQQQLDLYNSRIQMLELSHCMELKSIKSYGNAGDSLRRLRIYQCPELYLTDNDGLHSLLYQVEELIIDSCECLDLSGIQNMTRLRHLELKGLPRLVTLPAGLQSATSLEYFMIADCRSFKDTANVLQNLKSLKKLCIYSCPALSALTECAPTLETLDIRNCPTLIESYLTNKGQNYWQRIPYIILDGKCSKRQKSDFLKRTNTAAIPQVSAEGDLYFPPSISYFDLKATVSDIEIFKNDMKLHCLLFPEDYEFERDTIIQLWMAAGFLRLRRKEEIGMICFDMLENEGYICFLRIDILTGKRMYKVNIVKVTSSHNRSGMINGANKDQYLILKNNHTEAADVSNARHVCVLSNNNPIDETTLKVLQTNRELKTLMFITPNGYGSSLKQVPDGLFLALPDLQALDLSRTQITNLPTSIGNVTCLSYLDVSFTLIEKLPESIQHLTKLQTLKLKGCEKLYTLPKGLTKLVSLRHLEFDAVRRLTGMPKGISSLTELRTLSTFIVGNTEEDSNINELQYLKNLCGSLSIHGLERVSGQNLDPYLFLLSDMQITHLELKWGTGFETISQSSLLSTEIEKATDILQLVKPNFKCIEELHILSFPGSILFPQWKFSFFSEKLVHISLLKCENSDLNWHLGDIRSLKFLSITQMNRVTEIGRLCSYIVGFPKLEELEMDGMLGLKSWTGIRREDFPLLRKLKVMHCPELKELDFLPFLGSLKYLKISSCEAFESLPDTLPESLETLMINDCPMLESRCLEKGGDWDKIKNVPNIWIDEVDIRSSGEQTSDEDETHITGSDEDETHITDSDIDVVE